MALVSSGKISLADVATEFGGSAPHSMSEYLRGGSNVPTTLTGTASVSAPGSDTDDVVVGGLDVKVKSVTAVAGTGFNLTADNFYDFTISKSTSATASGTTFEDNQGNDRCQFSSASTTATISYTASNADTAVLTNSIHTSSGQGSQSTSSVDTDKTLATSVTASTTRTFSGGTALGACSGLSARTVNATTKIRTAGLASTNNTINITSGAVSVTADTPSTRYLWTNGTGGTITVEGTSVASANQDIQADGSSNFAISYTNATVNTGIPNDGSGVKVSMTDFYGGRKT